MTEKRFELVMQYWKTLPQGRQLVDHLTGEKGFGIDELCSIANGLYLQVEELKSANEVYKKCTTDLECENEQLKSQIKYIIRQIKAFRDDCHVYQDFNGQSTLNRLLDILENGKEMFE